jgi:1-acyl-sn-glycerol-3-phosphate acyltransferase
VIPPEAGSVTRNLSQMPLWHHHPPCRPEWQAQTAACDCSFEEFQRLRRTPDYTLLQKLIQVLYFLIFGIPKVILAFTYGLTAGIIYIIAANIWRVLGRPERGRAGLKFTWVVFARIFLFLLGFHRVRYHGSVESDTRFIVSNHTCFFDGWFFTPWGPRILAKWEMLKIPLMKETSDVFQAIGVDRGKSQGVTKTLIDNAKDPNAPIVFILSEGASTSGDYMLRFHLGAFLSDLPVQPVAMRYTLYGTSRSIAHISFFHHNLWQIVVFLGIPSISLDVNFMEAMSIKSFDDDPRKFADAVSLKIANHLGVRLLNRSSSELYRRTEERKKDE